MTVAGPPRSGGHGTPDRTAAALAAFVGSLAPLAQVTDVLVAGSLATGDYVEGVSDLDLVALVDGRVDDGLQDALAGLHTALDAGPARGLALGCVYVDTSVLDDRDATHPTWTHGRLLLRVLSGVTRAELATAGYALRGRAPSVVLPAVRPDDVRAAARAELTGYWAGTLWRPWWYLDPVLADLGLTSAARGLHALTTGTLLTKSAAIEVVDAPDRLRTALSGRRAGHLVRSPRVSTAWHSWRAVRRAVDAARAGPAE